MPTKHVDRSPVLSEAPYVDRVIAPRKTQKLGLLRTTDPIEATFAAVRIRTESPRAGASSRFTFESSSTRHASSWRRVSSRARSARRAVPRARPSSPRGPSRRPGWPGSSAEPAHVPRSPPGRPPREPSSTSASALPVAISSSPATEYDAVFTASGRRPSSQPPLPRPRQHRISARPRASSASAGVSRCSLGGWWDTHRGSTPALVSGAGGRPGSAPGRARRREVARRRRRTE